MALKNWADIWGDIWGDIWELEPIGTTIAPAVGTISISGQAVTLVAATQLAPANATITISGESVSLVQARSFTVERTTIVINGQAVEVDAVFVVTDEGILIFPLINELIYSLIDETNKQ